MLVVRHRSDDDFETLEQVAARVRAADDYPAYLRDHDYRRFLTRPVPILAWVAEWDGRVCGHVALTERSSPAVMEVIRRAGIGGAVGVIARLLVDPDIRRRGVARALLQTARTAASDLQRVPALDVVESHHAAVALYRRSSWVELGRVAVSLPDGRELHELVFTASV